MLEIGLKKGLDSKEMMVIGFGSKIKDFEVLDVVEVEGLVMLEGVVGLGEVSHVVVGEGVVDG